MNPIIEWHTLQQYAQPVPRYTSYPTAPAFSSDINHHHMQQALKNLPADKPVSLYTHFPFCRELCWYCGCNTKVNRKPGERQDYLDNLLREMTHVVRVIGKRLPARQVHFGGGTPNYMSDAQFRAVISALRSYFEFLPDAEISIELDPRLMNEHSVETYATCGINRASLGIQDFNPIVQKAINRVQPYDQVRQCFEMLRDSGIDAINADLILGLPHQNETAFRQTLNQMIALKPSRIAIFNFAYLPQRYAHMKLIKQDHLPSTQEKFAMMKASVDMLTAAGYVMIGMDHFALPDDSLSQALREDRMHRNFQGYTTMPEMDMIGFGASAISMFDHIYLQNHSNVRDWHTQITHGAFATQRGIALSRDDRNVRRIIERIMCRFEVDTADIETIMGKTFDEAFPHARVRLHAMVADGLLIEADNRFVGTKTGKLLIRNVASIFDRYLAEMVNRVKFSKAV